MAAARAKFDARKMRGVAEQCAQVSMVLVAAVVLVGVGVMVVLMMMMMMMTSIIVLLNL